MNSSDPYRVRRAVVADATAIAAVHAQVWRETYTGLMPERLIEGAPMDKRVAAWTRALGAGHVCFAAEDSSGIAGWASCGATRDARLEASGEILAINILAAHHRRGIGRALMAACAESLQEQRMLSAGLWVLDANAPARRFYERLGGRATVTRDDDRDGVVLREIAYVWPDAAALRARD